MTTIKSIIEEVRFLINKDLKAFYIGWHGNRNLGDEALLCAIQQIFKNKIYFYSKKYVGKGVRYFKPSPHFDYVFLGGGTLINSGAAYLRPLKSFHDVDKIVFGTGVLDPEFLDYIGISYDLNHWVDELNKCKYIGLRGPLSENILKRGAIKNKLNIIGDPVLFLSNETIYKKKRNKFLGVNISYMNQQLWGNDDEYVIKTIIDVLIKLKNNGWKFKFFPLFDADISCIQKVVKKLKLDEDNVIFKKWMDIDLFMDELGKIDVFIGEKLHSVVLSMCTYTPSIMLEYQPKCRDFMKSMDLEEYNFRTDRLQSDVIIDAVYRLYEDITFIQEKIYDQATHFKKLMQEAATKIINKQYGI